MTSTTPKAGAALPKNGQPVIRAYRSGIKLRAAADGGMPTLFGHFAVFNRFTEIDSWMEGHFLEQIARGAFKKTFRDKTPKVLFQHGQDPQVGDKPLGTVESLAEDKEGAAYEVRMLDTAYNRDLVPGLEAGLYGASFRFKVMREEIVDAPPASAENPTGLPERTIKEAQVMEFGPVTFPAYDDATAGVRSLTDRFLFDALERDPAKARDLLRAAEVMRFDNEDVSTLAQMIALGTEFIDDQDEPDEAGNVKSMEGVLATLATLLSGETTETEPVEPEDENEGRSKTTDAAVRRTSGRKPDAATTSTSDEPIVMTWPKVPREEWETGKWIPRT